MILCLLLSGCYLYDMVVIWKLPSEAYKIIGGCVFPCAVSVLVTSILEVIETRKWSNGYSTVGHVPYVSGTRYFSDALSAVSTFISMAIVHSIALVYIPDYYPPPLYKNSKAALLVISSVFCAVAGVVNCVYWVERRCQYKNRGRKTIN
jgi:hypothetical protein